MKQTEIEASIEVRIGQLIRERRTAYVQGGLASSYFEINNGLCEDFACEMVERVKKEFPEIEIMDVEGGNFQCHDEDFRELGWDRELLRGYWNISVPDGFTWEELDAICFGNHIWMTCGKRHYDAECPEGVVSFFDLPFFRRYMVQHARLLGRVMPEVEVEDVVASPNCPIPNPL